MATVERLWESDRRRPPDQQFARLRQIELENEHLRRAVTELSVLNDLARAIGAAHDPESVMRTIVMRSIGSLHAEEGVITLCNHEEESAARTLVREVRSSISVEPFHLRGAVLGWMQLNQVALVVNDPARDVRFLGAAWQPGIRSLLAVPLMVKGRLTGVLTVYNKQGRVDFDANDQRLLSIIASQSAQVIENARLATEERKLTGMVEQMRLAADVQRHLLADSIPAPEGWELAGTSIAADVVGGDYYDVLALPDGRLVACLGDVSGKGLPASLLMANVQAMVRLMAQLGFSTCLTMRHANELLCRCTAPNRFVTFFMAILDPSTGELEYCNAGHNPPMLIRASGTIECLTTRGAVLGMIPGFEYGCGRATIEPGDGVTIFSDGVTEALSPGDEQFGERRLVDVLTESRGAGASATLERLLDALRAHAEGRRQSDDITVLALKRA